MLIPDPYFAGAYPAHERILKGVIPRCIYRETACTKVNSFCKSLAFNKHQWGKSNALLAELIGDKEQALNLISREGAGMPNMMKLPHYMDVEVIRAITESESGLSLVKVIEQQMALHAPNYRGVI